MAVCDRERERGSIGLGEGLIGGVLGRAAGAMLGGAMRQLQNQQEQVLTLWSPALCSSRQMQVPWIDVYHSQPLNESLCTQGCQLLFCLCMPNWPNN